MSSEEHLEQGDALVDINTSSVEDLAKLAGLGRTAAEAIVAARKVSYLHTIRSWRHSPKCPFLSVLLFYWWSGASMLCLGRKTLIKQFLESGCPCQDLYYSDLLPPSLIIAVVIIRAKHYK